MPLLWQKNRLPQLTRQRMCICYHGNRTQEQNLIIQNYNSNRYFLTDRFIFPFPVPSEPQPVITLSNTAVYNKGTDKTEKGTVNH